MAARPSVAELNATYDEPRSVMTNLRDDQPCIPTGQDSDLDGPKPTTSNKVML
jgi:hypothetical protein